MSEFDSIFVDHASPELMATFGDSISIIAKSGESGTTTYTPTAQIGREIVRRVRTSDGMKVIRTREILVSTSELVGATYLPEAALKTLQYATIGTIKYVIASYDRAPGGMARLTLERSDPADISRPNMKGRR